MSEDAAAGEAATATAEGTGDDVSLGAPPDAEPTPSPPTLSTLFAVTLGAFAVVLLAAGSLLAGAVGLVALALLVVALARGSQRDCRVAGAAFVLGFVAAGTTGAAADPVVTAAVLAVAAWDVADHGLGLGAQVGREATTTRNELVHLAVSLSVGGGAGALAVGAFLAAGGGQPVTALVLLLVGGVILLVALRE